MRLFIINEEYLQLILNSLTIDDETKKILVSLIKRFGCNLVNFIYDIISEYTTYYISVTDKNSKLNDYEVENIVNKLEKRNISPIVDNIFIIDIYDLLYHKSVYDSSSFNEYFYSDVYDVLEKMLRTEKADMYLENIVESIKAILLEVEKALFSSIFQTDYNYLEGFVTVYIELSNECLKVYML